MINTTLFRRTILVLAVFSCTLTSCKNEIDKKDLTVIDGVQLGTSLDALYKQFDSLKVSNKIIYTKLMFSDFAESGKNKLKVYVTDIFNTSKYGSEETEHYGIYYPTKLTGTKNVVGLNVLLVHTAPAFLISKFEFSNLTKETQITGISQDISDEQADDIATMLSKKYGTPTDTLTFEYTKFYVLEGTQIRDYHSDSLNVGELYFWETKHVRIKYFKGIRSPNSTYNTQDHSYMTYFDSNPFRVINFENGERPCRSYSYITYELTDEAIQQLGLDKPRL